MVNLEKTFLINEEEGTKDEEEADADENMGGFLASDIEEEEEGKNDGETDIE